MEKASQDKREKNTSYQPEMHVRNANSREIFKNNRLTSQFLRNYTNFAICVIWQEYKATQNKINKIQSAEDLSEFRKVSEEMVESIYGNAPDEIKEIYKKIL